MPEGKPRIFIGIPCYRDVSGETLEDFMRFAYHCGRRMPQYEFSLGIRTKSEQFRARNAIVQAAQQTGSDYLLMLDDDMVADAYQTSEPTDAYSFVDKMIAHRKDICGILYYQRNGECPPVLMKAVGENGYRFLRDDEIEHRLQPVDVAGGGCLLIRMNLFDKLAPPYFEPEHKFGTDVQLCRSAIAKGFEVWADTSIEFGHVRNERVIVTSRNRHQFQMSDTMPGELKQAFVSSGIYDDLVKDGLEWTQHPNVDRMRAEADSFLDARKSVDITDPEWYRLYPRERVSRQIWYNSENDAKRVMTQYILGAIDHHRPLKILDFGCGIGVTAFALASKGHQVTALDLEGTGTFAFLKWRVTKYKVPMKFIESSGGPPRLSEDYDVIIAMDSIEHIEQWKRTVEVLADHLKPKGVLFSNNGILDDLKHPEHYNVENKAFLAQCLESNLMPFNQITFTKREVEVHA